MFSISKSLREAVLSKDARATRNAIIAYINADPDNLSGDAAQAAQYAIDNGVALWEEHDSSISMDNDQNHWNTNYTAYVTMTLYRNFSEERFAHWQDVAKEIRNKHQLAQAQEQRKTVPRNTHEESSRKEVHTTSDDMSRKILIGAAVAAAVIVTVAVVAVIK